MEENAHLPPRMWSGYGAGSFVSGEVEYYSGKVGGIPSPHCQLVYFLLQPYNVTQAGQVTLLLPTAGNAPSINTGNGVFSAVKSFYIPTGTQPAQLFEFIPPIPIGFDTSGPNTFALYNGLPIPNNPNSAITAFAFMVTVLPLH